MLMAVYHHGVMRAHVEGEQRAVPEAHTLSTRRSACSASENWCVSPVGQLGEEQVRGEASSQPGQAAQDGEPGQAGDGRRFGFGPSGHQERGGCCNNEEDEEDGGREGGRQGERRDKGR